MKYNMSSTEVSLITGRPLKEIFSLCAKGKISHQLAASGQKRFCQEEIYAYFAIRDTTLPWTDCVIPIGPTTQRLIQADSRQIPLDDNSIHLVATSPPYFNAKKHANEDSPHDVGRVDAVGDWVQGTWDVWKEVYRVLQPGRRMFVVISNLPIPKGKSFQTLNLMGFTIDTATAAGFVFKRDIIWQKTNGVLAAFGSYPQPGGILINMMHEFVLEFQKPGTPSYKHVSQEDREASRLTKDFWVGIKKSDVWLIPPKQSGKGRQHVAQFPVELPHRLIKAFTFQGETVLDPLCGAGSTLVAAAGLTRNGIGIDLYPNILHSALQRIDPRKPLLPHVLTE